jgi:hypothetical protein
MEKVVFDIHDTWPLLVEMAESLANQFASSVEAISGLAPD